MNGKRLPRTIPMTRGRMEPMMVPTGMLARPETPRMIIVTAGPAVKNRIPTAPCSDSSPNSPMMPV